MSRTFASRRPARRSLALSLESLDNRIVPAITASFAAGTGVLTITGDALDNSITVSRDAAGKLLVNGGAVAVLGGTPTVANTTLIQALGLGGNDTITLSEVNGALPRANLFGGSGNDILTGGSGNDLIFGQSGNDTELGKGGNDTLHGGANSDTLTGGTGNDQVFGGMGGDRMIWNPGDGTDLNEGGDGNDTVEVNGGNGAEQFTVTPNGSRVRFDRVNPAPFSLDIGTSEGLVVDANGGDDSFVASNGLSTLIGITVDGGVGNDSITGGDGNDTIIGGDGNDTIIGGRGNDTAFLGAGDDTFTWNPGDGSDTIEGQSGVDSLFFNGANIAENINIEANGSRVRFTRDIATITMDMDDVEAINFKALGGADNITVNDLSGTDVTAVNINLAASNGVGDAAADTVTVTGSAGDDAITAVGDANGTAAVLGLPALVSITGGEPANDRLVINAGAGDDVIDATGVLTGAIALTVNGNEGDDVLLGGAGNDTLIGDVGDDVLIGGPGEDVLNAAPGNDIVIQ